MATRSLGTLSVDLRANTASFSQGMDKAERATEDLNKATARQQKEFDRLVHKIDPVEGKLRDLDKQQKQLDRIYKKGGTMDAATYDRLNKKIGETRKSFKSFGDTQDRAAISAGQLANANRMLPAQFTDIAVSLQGGQHPLTVFLQQGGQIRDMYGSAGLALKEFGRLAMSMINPVTVSAAVVGSLALAAYQGSQETNRLRTSLALTGNTVGLTTGQLTDMASALDDYGTTTRHAVAALSEVVESGHFTAEQLETVTKTALALEQTMGQAIEDTIDQFAKLRDDPVKGIRELNNEYNFLTTEVYNNIAALVEQGNTVAAQELAMNTYADTMRDRASDVSDNLGWIEKAWNGVKSAASEAWDEMLGIGREATLEERTAQLRKDLEGNGEGRASGFLGTPAGSLGRNTTQRDAIKAEIAINEALIFSNRNVAQSEAEKQETQNKGIEASDELRKSQEKGLTTQQKLQKALKEYDDQIAAVRAADPDSALLDPAKIEAGRQAIIKANQDTKALSQARREAARAAKEAAKAEELYNKSVIALTDSLFPAQEGQRKFLQNQALLQTAFFDGKLSLDQYLESVERLQKSMMNQQDPSQSYSGFGFGSQIGQRDPFSRDSDDSFMKMDSWLVDAEEKFASFSELSRDTANNFAENFGSAFSSAITRADSLGEAVQGVGSAIVNSIVGAIAQMAAEWLTMKAIQLATSQSNEAAAVSSAAAAGPAIASAYAPAAAMTSLATFGANAPAASAGILSTVGVAESASFAGMFDNGGNISAGKWGIVGENGPEIVEGPMNVTSRRQTALAAAQSKMGSPTSNGEGATVNIINNSSSTVRQRRSSKTNETIIEIIDDMQNGGKFSEALTTNFNTARRAR